MLDWRTAEIFVLRNNKRIKTHSRRILYLQQLRPVCENFFIAFDNLFGWNKCVRTISQNSL